MIRYGNRKNSKLDGRVLLGINLVIVLAVAGMLVYGLMESKIIVSTDQIEIKGMYKTIIKSSDVESIAIKDTKPSIGRKTNGFNAGQVLRGNFIVDNQKGKLFIYKNTPPYIYIKTNDGPVVINLKESNRTLELYKEIENKFNY